MKQTAVEWLVEQLKNGKEFNENLINQAKEMEKEQIMNSFEVGYDNGACVQEENAIYHGSKYYKETFKSE